MAEEPEEEQQGAEEGESRRQFIKKLPYIAPAIETFLLYETAYADDDDDDDEGDEGDRGRRRRRRRRRRRISPLPRRRRRRRGRGREHDRGRDD